MHKEILSRTPGTPAEGLRRRLQRITSPVHAEAENTVRALLSALPESQTSQIIASVFERSIRELKREDIKVNRATLWKTLVGLTKTGAGALSGALLGAITGNGIIGGGGALVGAAGGAYNGFNGEFPEETMRNRMWSTANVHFAELDNLSKNSVLDDVQNQRVQEITNDILFGQPPEVTKKDTLILFGAS